MNTFHSSTIAVVAALAFSGSIQAANIFTAGDAVIGGASDGVNFNVGVEGFVDGANNWPGGEPPLRAIDGAGQKYLNFGEINTGVLVTPSFNGGAGSVVTGLTLWTANDSPERDPSSYEVYGTNQIIGGGPFPLSTFLLISSGPLALPETRNAGGVAVLDPLNSQALTFPNTASYTSYLVLFPTVKNVDANSMQIAEIQLDGVVPEPATAGLAALSAGLLLMRRRGRVVG